MVILNLLFLISNFIFTKNIGKNNNPYLCQDQTNCDLCMKVSAECRWCSKNNFPYKRCNLKEHLIKQGCDEDLILNYPSHIKIINDAKKTKYFTIIPGSVTVYFRPYDTLTFDVAVKITEFSPVETAIILDFSRSMRKVFAQLIEKIKAITIAGLEKGIQRIGIAKYVDKASHPIIDFREYNFNSIDKRNTFNFGIIHPLSNDSQLLVNSLNAEAISKNIDMKEALLDAIVQTVSCKQMGWSNEDNMIKTIVAITDDLPKIQFDARNVGVIRPHNLECHIQENNMDQHGMDYDYPSISQTGYVLHKSKTELILAVNHKTKIHYRKITNSWKGVKSVVSDINFDNFNLLDLILNTRNQLNTRLEVSAKINDDLSVLITAKCLNSSINICYDVKLQFENIFEILITNINLFDDDKILDLYISSLYVLPIQYKALKTCECSSQISNQNSCNNHGNFACGGCVCDSNWGGKNCECNKTEINIETACKNPSTRSICSAKGTCDDCGKCSCYTANDGLPYEGDFCECERKNCGHFENKICGGPERGKCVCDMCVCTDLYTGNACENIKCNSSDYMATCSKDDTTISCSGVGECNCGTCVCPFNKGGEFCEIDIIKIDCAYFEIPVFCFVDALTDDMRRICNNDKINLFISQKKSFNCSQIDTNNCRVKYNYFSIDGNMYRVEVKEKIHSTDCIKPVNIQYITGLVFVMIFLVGFLIIGGYFMSLYLYYRADYIKFVKEIKGQSNAQTNPLFEKPDTEKII